MSSPHGGEGRYSPSHPSSSPALSPQNPDVVPRSATPNYQDPKHNLIPNAQVYERANSQSDSPLNGSHYVNEKAGEPALLGSDGKKMEVVEREQISGSRKRWVFFVWMLTFWMPSFLIRWIVKTPRKDIRQAWREKLAINLLIWLSCGSLMFFMGTWFQ
jgi:chitin synthase